MGRYIPSRLFTALLVVLGVGTFGFVLTRLTDYLMAGELQGELRRKRMQRLIDSFEDHFIVCGYGEMGRQVCSELRRTGRPVVVVDRSESATQRAVEDGFPALAGDAGLDRTLTAAGVERAAGLVAATDDDPTNLLVVLTARGLNSGIRIVARANLAEVERKLIRAGANGAVFAQSLAGRRLARMLTDPAISDLRDLGVEAAVDRFRLRAWAIPESSRLAHRTLRECPVRESTGATVVAFRRSSHLVPSPSPDDRILPGDLLLVAGTEDQLRRFQEQFL